MLWEKQKVFMIDDYFFVSNSMSWGFEKESRIKKYLIYESHKAMTYYYCFLGDNVPRTRGLNPWFEP